MTGEQRCLVVPPLFKRSFLNGAVLCTDKGHVHGACQFSHFKVVLVCKDRKEKKLLAFVYSSDTGVWGDLISTEVPSHIRDTCTHGSLVGNAFYWLLSIRDGILMFDLDMQRLALIKGPPVVNSFCRDRRQIIQAENGVVGLAILYYPRLEIWQRNVDFHGVATWLLQKTIEMCTILGLPPQLEGGVTQKILAYSEEIDAIFIYVNTDVCMVQLKSMQSKRLHESCHINNYHPFTSFYTPGYYSCLAFML
uniref:F-box protein AT5G49610-like beta-propeller domain-containing protein n=1 Tax=Aegilops tauschii TaxID=37682 RepID=M8CYL2_AEGTA